MIDADSWEISQFAVRTGHRLSGKEMFITTKDVDRISYEESTLFVSLSEKMRS